MFYQSTNHFDTFLTELTKYHILFCTIIILYSLVGISQQVHIFFYLYPNSEYEFMTFFTKNHYIFVIFLTIWIDYKQNIRKNKKEHQYLDIPNVGVLTR